MTKILLVEDDPLLIDIYTTKFKQSDLSVEVESDGEKVIKKIEDMNPELVILDIVLPHMDGWDILYRLRKNKFLKNTKVLILSNLGQEDEVKRGMDFGVAKYLIKADYTPTQVLAEVQKLIDT